MVARSRLQPTALAHPIDITAQGRFFHVQPAHYLAGAGFTELGHHDEDVHLADRYPEGAQSFIVDTCYQTVYKFKFVGYAGLVQRIGGGWGYLGSAHALDSHGEMYIQLRGAAVK